MIKNNRHYQKVALREKIARLKGLTIAKAARDLETLVDFGWRFLKKRARPLPVALRYLIHKKV